MLLTFSMPCSNVTPKRCILLEYMLEYVRGVEPRWEKTWMDCMRMYVPMISNSHCFEIEIVFVDSTKYVYISDHNHLTRG